MTILENKKLFEFSFLEGSPQEKFCLLEREFLKWIEYL